MAAIASEVPDHIELQPLLLRGQDGSSSIEPFVIPTELPEEDLDRQGWAWTLTNMDIRPDYFMYGERVPFLDPENPARDAEYFDVAFMFPKEVKGGSKRLSGTEVARILRHVFVARDDKEIENRKIEHPKGAGRKKPRLHPCYGDLKVDELGATTRAQLFEMIFYKFVELLDILGCQYVCAMPINSKYRILKARLTEHRARRLADIFRYVLQFDGRVSSAQGPHNSVKQRAAQYKQNSTLKYGEKDILFVPPYRDYEEKVEKLEKLGAMSVLGHVWMRYDRISRPITSLGSPSTQQTSSQLGPVKGNKELSIFKDIDRMRLLQLALTQLVNIQKLKDMKFYVETLCLPQPPQLAALRANSAWGAYSWRKPWDLPLDEIRDYFGEEVAMFFAWQCQFVSQLQWFGVCGLTLFIISMIFDPELTFNNRWLNWCRIIYCCGIAVVWSSYLGQKWSRYQAIMNVRWGLQCLARSSIREAAWDANPKFRPDGWAEDPVEKGKMVKVYDFRKRIATYCLTYTITIVATVICVILVNDDMNETMFKYFQLPTRSGLEGMMADASQFYFGAPYNIALTVASFLNSGVIKMFDAVWRKYFAFQLTELENHETLTAYKNSAALKLLIFKCFVHFTPLLYLAVLKEHFQPCSDTKDGRCLIKLRRQLITLYAVHIFRVIMTLILPLVKTLFKTLRRKHKDEKLGENISLDIAETEMFKDPYAGSKGIMSDYQESILDIGLLALFSVVCPVLPFIAFFFNLLELRLDILRVCTAHRRPFPEHSGVIGVWEAAMHAMGYLTIASNALLSGFITLGLQGNLNLKLIFTLIFALVGLIVRDILVLAYPSEGEKTKMVRARMYKVMQDATWGEDLPPDEMPGSGGDSLEVPDGFDRSKSATLGARASMEGLGF